MHTAHSGDSQTPVEDALAWYARHDYDFVVITDHNHVTVGRHDSMLVLPGVELTQNLRRCVPEPRADEACLLHVNALVVDPQHQGMVASQSFGIPSREEVFADSIARADDLGGIAQLNHPNFHHAADEDLLAALAGRLRLFELANEAVDSNNDGGEGASTEEMWDAVLSRGHRLWGTATDDAHHYDDAEAVRNAGQIAHTGDRGWVMVFARRNAASIREALRDGRFYASNGVLLDTVEVSEDGLVVEASSELELTFIGRGGRVLDTARGTRATYPIEALADGDYVRCVATDDAGRRAWTQPVFY